MSLDRAITLFDAALRTLSGTHRPARPFPSSAAEDEPLSPAAREESAALMRVNHVGEVCAQALYAGQALTARNPQNREALEQAAREERDHLAWSAQRIEELNGRESLLNPLWYAGSFAIGTAAGALGDRWNLAFLAETERQVEAHLAAHQDRLSPDDPRTRDVVEAMRLDEARHRATALELGAAKLPEPIRLGMRIMAKVMTTLSYRV